MEIPQIGTFFYKKKGKKRPETDGLDGLDGFTMIKHCDKKATNEGFRLAECQLPKKGLARILGKRDFTKRHGQQNIKPVSKPMKGISDSIGDKNGYDGFSMEGHFGNHQ